MEKFLIDKFINDLYLFVEDDYLSPVHNFNRDLKYSVKELDEHYNSGYRDLFDAYYKDFILLKELGNYENITICYDLDKDDYFFEVDIRQMVGAEERRKKYGDFTKPKDTKYVPGQHVKGSFRDGNYQRTQEVSRNQRAIGMVTMVLLFAVIYLIFKYFPILIDSLGK